MKKLIVLILVCISFSGCGIQHRIAYNKAVKHALTVSDSIIKESEYMDKYFWMGYKEGLNAQK